MTQPNAFSHFPDANGLFGAYGGRFVAETLMPNVLALEKAYAKWKDDPAFVKELEDFARDFVGRPSPLYFAERLTEEFGGAQVWFKRDELNHTGAHKINNCWAVLLARLMGRPASSPRPAQASMASLPRRWRPASACRARSIWAQPMWSGKSPTSSA